MRAATPTAAAELATPSIEMLKGNVNYYITIMTKYIRQRFENEKLLLANLDRRIDAGNPLTTLKHHRNYLEEYCKQLQMIIQKVLLEKKSSYRFLEGKLNALNPLSLMNKGYSINTVNDEIITDVSSVHIDDIMITKLKNGELKSKVIEVKQNGK